MADGWRVAYLGLGSNLGDRAAYLEAAAVRLATGPGVRVRRRSAIYETEPIGYTDQPWFLNQVVEAETSLSPEALLRRAKAVEAELGRRAGPRWGPRPIDVDLLLYAGRAIETPELRVPHPELWNRLFVLVPLAELCPALEGPDGQPIEARMAALAGTQIVRPFRRRG